MEHRLPQASLWRDHNEQAYLRHGPIAAKYGCGKYGISSEHTPRKQQPSHPKRRAGSPRLQRFSNFFLKLYFFSQDGMPATAVVLTLDHT